MRRVTGVRGAVGTLPRIARIARGLGRRGILHALYGSMLVDFGGWHHLLGDLMHFLDLAGTALVALGALRSRS